MTLQPVHHVKPKTLLADTWISAEHVAKKLNVSKMTVYRMLDRDELLYVRVGRTIRISLASFEMFMEQGGTADDVEVSAPQNLRLA